METIFSDFIKHQTVDNDLLLNYKDKLPEELIEKWQTYGFGTFANGFLKVINPDDYSGILEKSYLRHKQAIPIFTTAMGDLLVWEKNKYVNLLNFRKGYVTVVSSGFDFFFDDVKDREFMNDELMWQPYPEAIRNCTPPDYDECFGYTPLLRAGGAEKIENLKKGKLKEHLLLMTEFMGPIQ